MHLYIKGERETRNNHIHILYLTTTTTTKNLGLHFFQCRLKIKSTKKSVLNFFKIFFIFLLKLNKWILFASTDLQHETETVKNLDLKYTTLFRNSQDQDGKSNAII